MSNLIAACVGDMHVCPIKGHGSSPIMPNGSSILVEGKPIARVGDVTGCGAVITQGYPLAIADGMPVAYLGRPTSHGGSIVSGNPRVILGVATNTAPVVDFAMAGALDDKGQLTPAAKELLDKDPQEFVRKAAQKGALIDEGLPDEEPKDSPTQEDRPTVRVEAGIFFDGTGNNRDNTQTYQQQMDECLTANAAGAISEEECSSELSQIMEGSYLNAETNVSKLENLYQREGGQSETGERVYRLSTYVSGVGTKSGEPDDGPSMGLGLGEQGILKKIEEGSNDLAISFKRAVDESVDELILDVFGFSRGAATARHFISREVQDESGALAAAFKQQGIPWPKKITVRFVGLFDTVAGVADLGNLDFSAHDAEPGRINVNLRPDVGGHPLASSPVAGKSPLEQTRSGRQCRDWDFGFQGGAKGLRPGVGLIVQFMESARAVWRSVFGEVSIVAAGIVQLPGGFQVWLGPFFQTAVAGQAEEEIGVRIVERQLHQFHVGKVGIAAQKDAGLGPVLAHPLENHRVLRALRAFAGAQRGGDEPARQAFEQKQRQVAVTLVMVVVKRQFLLAVDPIFGVIHVEHDHLWQLGVAGDNLFHKGLGQPMNQTDLLVNVAQQQGAEVG